MSDKCRPSWRTRTTCTGCLFYRHTAYALPSYSSVISSPGRAPCHEGRGNGSGRSVGTHAQTESRGKPPTLVPSDSGIPGQWLRDCMVDSVTIVKSASPWGLWLIHPKEGVDVQCVG